jgi:hypothetical protein
VIVRRRLASLVPRRSNSYRRSGDIAQTRSGVPSRPWVARALVLALVCVGVPVAAVAPATRAMASSDLSWSDVTPGPSNPPSAGGPIAYDPATGDMVMTEASSSGSVASWSWDGKVWTDQTPALATMDLTNSTLLAYDSATSQLVAVAGGATWTWAGSSWTQADASAPATDSGYFQAPTSSMAFDDASNQLILVSDQLSEGDQTEQTWTWDGSTWTQLSPNVNPPARGAPSLAYDPAVASTGGLVLFGGYVGSASESDTWVWDGSDWSAQSVATSPPGRAYGVMAYDPIGGQLVLYGGDVPGQYGGMTSVFDTWEFDGTTWNEVSDPNMSWRGHGLAYDTSSSELLLVTESGSTSATWAWQSSSWKEVSEGTGSLGDGQADTAYDPAADQMLTVQSDLTYAWEDGSWVALKPSTEPQGVGLLAYDPTISKLVWYQENAEVGAVATWVWDGSNWTYLLPNTFPPVGLKQGSLAYDTSSGNMVLVGDFSGTEETWTFDGSNWAQQSPATEPPVTDGASLAYDPNSTDLIFYGGESSGSAVSATWAWDGSNWTVLAPADSPPAVVSAALAYDPAANALVLAGLSSADGSTWAWDGTDWNDLGPAVAPAVRQGAGFAWDPDLSEMLLVDGNKTRADTWAYGTSVMPAPVITSVTPYNRTVGLTWTAPELGPGVIADGYRITAEPGGLSTEEDYGTAANFSGLTNGTSYTFTVAPLNADGTFPASTPSSAVTPLAGPDEPTHVALVASPQSISLQWQPPASDAAAAAPTGYVVTFSTGLAETVSASTTSVTLHGLTDGEEYWATIQTASNSGPSRLIFEQAIPYAGVGMPQDLKASSIPGGVRLSWSPAKEGVSGPIVGYRVSGAGHSAFVSNTTLSYTFANVTPGWYPFTVAAVTSPGIGEDAYAVYAQPGQFQPPTEPRSLRAKAGNANVLLSWRVPASDGGKPILGYELRVEKCKMVNSVCAQTFVVRSVDLGEVTRSYRVTRLQNGHRYYFQIWARSSIGNGGPASVSAIPKR